MSKKVYETEIVKQNLELPEEGKEMTNAQMQETEGGIGTTIMGAGVTVGSLITASAIGGIVQGAQEGSVGGKLVGAAFTAFGVGMAAFAIREGLNINEMDRNRARASSASNGSSSPRSAEPTSSGDDSNSILFS
ncbi:MAG: hypothetical protein FWB72_04320 [Firmicutes bacterium]|nr:hypothetical protein [Bacillota bacterium]